MTDVIPDDVKQFILLHIDSIAQWEALLLLRTDPAMEWSAATIAQRIYVSEAEAEKLLAQLAAQGFLSTRTTFYRYQPRQAEMDPMVGRIAELYAQYLVPITHLIHSKRKPRVQEFADAFRIRKD